VTLLAIFGEDYPRVEKDFAVVGDESRNLLFVQTCATLRQIISEIAEERRSNQRDANDILGMMMRTRDRESDCPMSDSALASQGITLVIAGHETTASVLNWVWYLLAKHPHVEERLLAELRSLPELNFEALGKLTYMQQVLEEALRTYPPLWYMTRRAVQSDYLGEYHVPAGTEIYISPFILQRHPGLWEIPDDFNPDRFVADADRRHPLATCPFGAGPRNCIGELFARIEMQVHLALILSELHLAYDVRGPAEFVAGVNLLSRNHFVMRPTLRPPVA
jgi:cytochrome P450